MGACCCSNKEPDQGRASTYYYCSRISEVRQPLTSNHDPASDFSMELLVDTSIPDTYQPPPAPLPYDLDLGHSGTRATRVSCSNKSNFASTKTGNIGSIEEVMGTVNFENSAKCEDVMDAEYKVEPDFEVVNQKVKIEVLKSSQPLSSSEQVDTCPTCFEDYDVENPKINTKCEHHFHLACILEWMEKSDTCPVCDKEMIFSPLHQ